MIVKSIKIRADVFPQSRRETPHEIEELENVAKFVQAIEDAAKKYLPAARAMVKIKEFREKDAQLR